MTLSTIGPLRVRSFGGNDRQGGGDGPAILLCHGWGAPGDDLCPLSRVVSTGREVRWFFPEAPLTLDTGFGRSEARAWWSIDMGAVERTLASGGRRGLADRTPAGLASARSALEELIEALVRDHNVRRDQLIIGGFSQGGMLTTEVALFADEPFAGLVVLSSTLLSQDRWREAASRLGPRLAVFLTHGRGDPTLPFEGAEALYQLLEEAGAKVDWVPHNGQHGLPMTVIDRLGAFVRARFATI